MNMVLTLAKFLYRLKFSDKMNSSNDKAARELNRSLSESSNNESLNNNLTATRPLDRAKTASEDRKGILGPQAKDSTSHSPRIPAHPSTTISDLKVNAKDTDGDKNQRPLRRRRASPSNNTTNTSPISPSMEFNLSYKRHLKCVGAHASSDITPSRYTSPDKYNYIQALAHGPSRSRSSTRFQRFLSGQAIHQLNPNHKISLQTKYRILLWMKGHNVGISQSSYLLSLEESLHHRQLSRKLSQLNAFDPPIIPPIMDLTDEWCNGVILSAIIASIVMKYDRSQVKEVSS